MSQIEMTPLIPEGSEYCSEREIMNHVMSRWGALALVLLLERRYRFNELRRHIGGVSDKMLAQTLRVLEEDGFVERQDYREIPPRVDYALTPMGREAAEHVAGLVQWISKNAAPIQAARERYQAERADDQP